MPQVSWQCYAALVTEWSDLPEKEAHLTLSIHTTGLLLGTREIGGWTLRHLLKRSTWLSTTSKTNITFQLVRPGGDMRMNFTGGSYAQHRGTHLRFPQDPPTPNGLSDGKMHSRLQ